MTHLRLDDLTLHNFRCFTNCEVGLHPRLTVLVAENGHGKTAILDAASLALSAYVNALYPPEKLKKIQRSDVRLAPVDGKGMTPTLPTRIVANGSVANIPTRWATSVKTYGAKVRPSTRELKDLQRSAASIRDGNDNPVLPLVAFYGTGRLWGEHRLTEGRRTSVTSVSERLTGYSECLTSSSSFRGVETWYEHRTKELASPAFKESVGTNVALLTAVREAARTVLEPTGWSNLDWDATLGGLVADHQEAGRLPLSSLSDGVRTMLALVADVARRCASLNPHLSANAVHETPGVLLIDEVDMHLHPRWQQVVIDRLQTAFPSLQLVVTTHSPHVLSTVDRESIRVLRTVNGQSIAQTPGFQTKGVISADVLASIMGVDPIPQVDEASWVRRYRELIEDGLADSEEAAILREKLVGHFGQQHPLMIDCDRLIRFQAFRVKRQSKGDAGDA